MALRKLLKKKFPKLMLMKLKQNWKLLAQLLKLNNFFSQNTLLENGSLVEPFFCAKKY